MDVRTEQVKTESARRTGRRAALWTLVSMLLLIAPVLLLAAGCGSSEKSPGEVMEDMVRATYDGDCEAVVNSMAQEFLDAAGGDRQAWINSCNEQIAAATDRPSLVSFEITDETIDGDHAQVSYTLTEDVGGQQETSTRTMDMVRENGEWKYTLSRQALPTVTQTQTVQ